jgi:hypothetical protein
MIAAVPVIAIIARSTQANIGQVHAHQGVRVTAAIVCAKTSLQDELWVAASADE